MKKSILIFTFATTLLLAACGEEASDPNDREVTTAAENTEGQESEEVAEEPAESSVGVRSNPLPMGDTITTDVNMYDDDFNALGASLDLTVTEVIRGQEAWDIITAENQFNEPAKEGYEYILVKVKGMLKDAETEDYPLWFSSGDFQFVDKEGATYDSFSVVIPNELGTELYNGGSSEGYIHNQIKVDDETKLTFTSSSGAPVFFNLQ